MITSNLPLSGWEQIFKDPTGHGGSYRPPRHHSVILELNVESYRLGQSQKEKH